jgi:AAHS family 4-hydroxybenzoate transporter-like MFS transporter
VGGALLSLGFSFATVFSVLAVPAVIAAIAIVMNRVALRFITSPVADV